MTNAMPTGRGHFLSVMIETTEATLYSSQPWELGEDGLAKENRGLWSDSADMAEG